MTTRRRPPGPLVLAASLLTAALPITATAGNSAHASSSPRSLPAYAHGSISGAGPHNGVRLELVAWPKAKIAVGQKVHLQVIGTAKSTSTGSYTIHPTVALPKGIHNLEVLARSSKAVGAFSFARKIAGRGRALAVDGSRSTGPVRANIHMMALPKSALPAVPHPGVPCIITRKVREFGPRMVDVGGLYSFVTGAAMKMTYTAGASTTMGVAISVPFPGEVGSFSAEGTFTETAARNLSRSNMTRRTPTCRPRTLTVSTLFAAL